MDQTRRAILDRLDAKPTSGPTLAADLNVSRAAVWKHINALRDAGVKISSSAKGYTLEEVPEYGEAALIRGLPEAYDLVYEDKMSSTNDVARELAAAGRDKVLVATHCQPRGKGRLNRPFEGPAGGIFVSVLIRPDLSPAAVPLLTLASAVATVDALAPIGVDASIKWPNDVLHENAKLAGILTEMEGEADQVSWVIVGVGINANVHKAALPQSATSLLDLMGKPVNRRDIVHDFVDRFDELQKTPDKILPAWRSRAVTIGQRVRVTTPTDVVEGRATDIVHPGALLVETADGPRRVHAGDCEHLRPVT